MVPVVRGYGHLPGLLADCKIAPGASQTCFVLVRNTHFLYRLQFFLSEAVGEVPGTLVATTIDPRPLGSVALLPSQGAGGPARVFPPMESEFVVATPHLTHGVSLPPPWF